MKFLESPVVLVPGFIVFGGALVVRYPIVLLIVVIVGFGFLFLLFLGVLVVVVVVVAVVVFGASPVLVGNFLDQVGIVIRGFLVIKAIVSCAFAPTVLLGGGWFFRLFLFGGWQIHSSPFGGRLFGSIAGFLFDEFRGRRLLFELRRQCRLGGFSRSDPRPGASLPFTRRHGGLDGGLFS